MQKNFRIAHQLAAELGLSVVTTYRNKHYTLVLRTPGGKVFNVQISSSFGNHCMLHNMRSQWRRRARELDGVTP
jgi:hypothetical protein